MQLLKFDEINKYQTFVTWIEAMPVSEVMEQKWEIRDKVWDLLEYLYVLGFKDAREEVGVIAEDVATFLPPDYMEQKWDSIYKRYDGLDFSDRVLAYAEMGDIPSIVRVAETDGHRVYNDGGYVGAKGFAQSKTWHTMLDEKVRDTHDYLEGMTVGIDERFYTFDGDSALYPGDFSFPQNVINCRCVISYNSKTEGTVNAKQREL